MEFVGLSDAQAEIVCSDAKKIIVDAGSGAGKTRTLTEKVRMLLESGEDPKSIVVITFTNMAANELIDRLSTTKGSDKCFVGTIHSYANNILKLGGSNHEVFSEQYQTQFMQTLIPKYARYCTFDDYKQFVKYDRMVSAGRMSASDIPYKFPSNEVYNEIMYLLGRTHSYRYEETVMTLCKANNIITFDEMLERATEYFKKNNTKPKYLFVDELQDIGYLEYNFLMSINSEYTFCIGDDFQCQPKGTLVMMGDGTYKPIEDVSVGDSVTSYSVSDGYYFHDTQRGKGKKVTHTQVSVSDRLIDIVLKDGHKTTYTPNHRCFARINYTDETKDMSVVYIMENEQGRFRVGSTKLFVTGDRNFGLRNRMNTECGVRGWILGVYETANEAWVAEQICSYKFGIPQVTWMFENARFSAKDLDYVYESLGDLREKADACLRYFGRDINYPIFTKDKNIHFSKLHVTEVHACNLLPKVMDMAIPNTSETRYTNDYSTIESAVVRHGSFDVYCIEVENTGTYVADGILTHNSIFAFKGGDVEIFLSLMHNPEWKTFYLTENYRTAKSIIRYANTVIKQAKNIIPKDVIPMSDDEGELNFCAGTLFKKFVSEIKDGEDWFILTRTNKEMCFVESVVKELGKEYYCFKQSNVSDKKMKEIRSKKCIKIMTVHASKGQECDNVALYGRFPIKGTKDEDEYKVYYVGITRAKHRCNIFV